MNTTKPGARMPPDVQKLNRRLGAELGFAPSGEPLYMFQWTEDLFWPLYKTGSKVLQKQTYEVPLLGTNGQTQKVEENKWIPEYEKARMTHLYYDQWIVTAWLPPEGLKEWVHQNNDDPEMDKAALSQWASNFEGADYPRTGFHVCTNYVIPQGDVPNIDDVVRFCAGVRHNQKMSAVEVGQHFKDLYDAAHPLPNRDPDAYNRNSEVGAAIANTFNAFMNPTPGRRGGSVSIGGVGENPVIRRKKSKYMLGVGEELV